MKKNKIELKSVRELLCLKFFIPSYQRGYRWKEQQVKDLLEDIWEFSKKKNNEYEFYCIQPLVVREMPKEDKLANGLNETDTWHEVIDGQQRLTTIYLILSSLKYAIKLLRLPTQLYELKYQREANKTAGYLSNISNIQNADDSQIDCYHISSAYHVITQWFEKEEVNVGDFCNVLLKHDIDKCNSPRDKANNIRFIWYESVDEDPVKVFTRLNIGKISLTNAELIKALFLNRSNFNTTDCDHMKKLRQQEIASEWDNIEYTLQNDEFWLFLHEKGYDRPTRIDFIFDLICEQNALDLGKKIMETIGTDNHKTFRYFCEYFKSREADIVHCWKEIKMYFQTFKEWYDDLQFYHYVGYLVACKQRSICELIQEWNKNNDKQTFISHLKEEINKKIDSCPGLDFQYKIDGSDKGKCRPILLFHNIQTVINQNLNQQNNGKYQIGAFYKFPFHLYKLENWDVEHINSNTSNPEDDDDTQKEWLLNAYLGADSDTQEKIKDYFVISDDKQKKVCFSEIKNTFLKQLEQPEQEEWSQEEKNSIWNYTLLDSSTNRSYGNTIFSGKRRVIIGKDKGKRISIPRLTREGKLEQGEESDQTSSFVPPCTKQVFMKYYSPTVNDNNYWTKSDAEGYRKDIKECLDKLGG